jgi:hypothetical protein
VRTRPRPSPVVEGLALDRLLNLAPGELEAQGAALLAALDRSEDRTDASIAGALLDVLEDPAFGLTPIGQRTPRRAMVEAVLRIGYPWALHLEPADLALVRTETRRSRRATLPQLLFAALLGATVGLVVARLMPPTPLGAIPGREPPAAVHRPIEVRGPALPPPDDEAWRH